jgi:hypothetical protein
MPTRRGNLSASEASAAIANHEPGLGSLNPDAPDEPFDAKDANPELAPAPSNERKKKSGSRKVVQKVRR